MNSHSILILSHNKDYLNECGNYLADSKRADFDIHSASSIEKIGKKINIDALVVIDKELKYNSEAISPKVIVEKAYKAFSRPVPIILLTDRDEKSYEDFYYEESTKSGIYDCLLWKGLTGSLLVHTLLHALKHNIIENKYKEKESFSNTLMNTIPTPVFYKDMEDKYIGCNESFEKFIGKSQSEISGKTDEEVIEGDCIKQFTRVDDDLKVNLSQVTYEGTICNPLDLKNNAIISKASFSLADNSLGGILGVLIDITDKRRYEEKLKKVNRILEQNPASIVITDMDGLIEYINPKFTEVTGYSFEEVAGKNPRVLKAGHHPEGFYKNLWETILRGDTWKGEFQNRKKSGESFWEIGSISPIRNDEGKITHFISVKEDITFQKYVEEALQKSKEKLRILFESLGEGIAVINLEGKILQVNESFLNLYEINSRRGVLLKNIDNFISEDDLPEFLKMLSYILESNMNVTAEYEVITKKGNLKVVELSVGLVHDQDGSPDSYVILTKDISERKETVKALRESEERNREILEAIPDIMFRVNSRGDYLDKSLYSKIKKIFPHDIVKKFLPIIEECFETGKIKVIEYPVYLNGELNYYEVRLIISGDDEMLIILRNINDRIYAREQLKKARDDAEAANESKSIFLANMSHEIRTPINSIMGFIELIARTDLDDRQRDYFNLVSISAQSLLGIINDILDFSKIESGRLEIDYSEFNPTEEFNSTIDLFTVKANEKNIKLLSYVDPSLPDKIIGDSLRIKQVLNNLLSNAIKFTQKSGTIIVEIKKEDIVDGEYNILFSVKDNGIGIDERKKKKIFEAFSQEDSGVSRKYGGTGLGLSISTNLVNLMGGTLKLKSEKGRGSEFYFNLMFKPGEKYQINSSLYEQITSQYRVGLYLEDNKISEHTKVIFDYLKALNFEVLTFSHIDEIQSCSKLDVILVVYSKTITKDKINQIDSGGCAPIILFSYHSYGASINEFTDVAKKVVFHPVYASNIIDAIVEVMGVTDYKSHVVDNIYKKVKFKGNLLIAEDNHINQKLIYNMMQEFDLKPDIVGNGMDAVEKVNQNNYDMVFMDVNMPLMDGIEATKMIREMEEKENRKPVPIVALTAKAMKGDRETLLEVGMNDYVSKPVSIESLQNVMTDYFTSYEVEEVSEVRGDSDEESKEDTPVKEGEGLSYDLNGVATHLGIKPEILKDLLSEYFDSTLKLFHKLERAIAQRDFNLMYHLAHKIKGSSANLQLTGIAEIAKDLEAKSENEDDVDFESIFESLQSSFEEAKTTVMLDSN